MVLHICARILNKSRKMKVYIGFFIALITFSSINAYAGLVNIEGETAEEICTVTLPKPYRNVVEDEDDLRLAIAENLSKLKKCSLKHPQDVFSFNLLVDLLNKASNPPLRYDHALYEKKWDEFAKEKNIKDQPNLKNQFLRKLKLRERYSYMRNIFTKFNFKADLFDFKKCHRNFDIFDACVREHIARKDNPENCYFKDVAFYEMDAEVEGLDNIYTFIMQPAVTCQIELEACTHFMDSLMRHFEDKTQ